MDSTVLASLGADLDWEVIHGALSARCASSRVYCKPLLVGWYNDLRKESAGGSQLLDVPDDTLAFLVYNGPGYIDTVFEYFLETSQDESCHFVDGATDAVLKGLSAQFSAGVGASTINLDKGPPYFHAQSLGVVAGVGQHLDPSEIQDAAWHETVSSQLLSIRSPDMWGSDVAVRQKIFGISMHPEFGGWFAYRGLLILHNVRASSLQRPTVVAAVTDEAEKKRILEEYNLRADDCFWRDLMRNGHPAEHRYTPEEMYFFTDMNLNRRKHFLQMRADVLKLDPAAVRGAAKAEMWGRNPQLVESLHRTQQDA